MLDLDAVQCTTFDLRNLEEDFTKEEVWPVIKSLELDKTHTPAAWIHTIILCSMFPGWKIIKKYLMEVVKALLDE